jgi:hypothetical protein
MMIDDNAVIEQMSRTGGGFVKALAQAASKADPDNLRRLKAAFPEYWHDYGVQAMKRKAEESK